MKLKKCVVCDNKVLKNVFSLGNQPLANNLLNSLNQKFELFPLEICLCKVCYHCQLTEVVEPKKLFDNYLYKSSISKSFIKHFKSAAEQYIKYFNLKKNSLIIDIGSNDGIGLIPFKKKGFDNLLAIEPAKNLAKITKKKKIKTLNNFLNNEIGKKFSNKADLILASNVFAHVKDIKNFSKNVFKMLKKDGVFIIEVQYLSKMLLEGSFDNIYHEHIYYWSLNSLINFFYQFNASIFKVEKINTHGGSIRVYIKKKNTNFAMESSVVKILKEEKQNRILSIQIYRNFIKKIKKRKKKLISKLNKFIKNKNSVIVGFGAPAKATTLINFFKLNKFIDYIIDDNILKNNKIIPNTNIVILNKKKHGHISCILVFAWNYYGEIKKNNKKLSKNFINIFKP